MVDGDGRLLVEGLLSDRARRASLSIWHFIPSDGEWKLISINVKTERAPQAMIPNAMPPFDFGLGETADALRDQVQRFAATEVAPIAAEIDKTDRFPRELWPKMGELGLHGITVEEEYGGSGLGYLEHVVAVEELSRALGGRRPVLRRAFQPLRQPDPPQRQRRAEAALPAQADLRRACRQPGHERSRARAPTSCR